MTQSTSCPVATPVGMTGLVSGLCAQMGTYWDPSGQARREEENAGVSGIGQRQTSSPVSLEAVGLQEADWAGSTVGVREAGQWNRVWSVIPRSSPPRKSPAGTVEAGAGLLHPPPRIWLCEEQLRARLRAARAALKPGGTGARAPWKRCGDLGHHCSLV